MSALDQPETWKRFFDQMMEIYVQPEINRRVLAQEIATDVSVSAAQVIFHGDGSANEVRLNGEVVIEALARLKPGVKAEFGLQLDDSDLEMSQFCLPENEYPNAAHATFIRNTSGRWFIAFDFRYNRTLAKQHFARAREFFSTATVAAERGYVAVCVDLLFSACELAVKAQLLSLPETKLAQKASHRGIAHHALR